MGPGRAEGRRPRHGRPLAARPAQAVGTAACLRTYWKQWQKATGNGCRHRAGATKKGQDQRSCPGGTKGVRRGWSVPTPTGHRGQTSQTGAEQEHRGGFGDRGGGFD